MAALLKGEATLPVDTPKHLRVVLQSGSNVSIELFGTEEAIDLLPFVLRVQATTCLKRKLSLIGPNRPCERMSYPNAIVRDGTGDAV